MPYLENHTLYYKKSCPYCQKVLRLMDDRKIMMDTRDTLQPGIQNDLVRVGGKKQVPCLVVNGKPLYESDDIVEYLRTQVPQSRYAQDHPRERRAWNPLHWSTFSREYPYSPGLPSSIRTIAVAGAGCGPFVHENLVRMRQICGTMSVAQNAGVVQW